MNEIQVFAGDQVWMCRTLGAEEAETVRLFGTNELPTAFMLAMPIEKVIAELAVLNPDHRIVHIARWV